MSNPDNAASSHRHAWDAIPWVVNGRASAADQRRVNEHVLVCADCRVELARQRSVQAAVAQEIQPLTDVDAGLKRLFKRIDETTDHRIIAGPGHLVRGRWQGARAINHWLVAAVFIEAVALSALGIGLALRGAPESEYQTLSENPAAPRRATILIVPAPDLQLGELQQQLHALNLGVVSGPTAAGAYALAPQGEQANLDAQIAGLRALPGMRLVEPIAVDERSR
jgi:hypothetical protein